MNKCRNWFRSVGLSLMTLTAAGAAPVQAGDYPDKPVTVISDAAPGATPDIDARFCAEGLAKLWGQQVVISQSCRARWQHRRPRRDRGRARRLYALHAGAFDLRRAAHGSRQICR